VTTAHFTLNFRAWPLFVMRYNDGLSNRHNDEFLNFMVTPCINNIQHFIFQLMHTALKNVVIKTF